MISKKIMVHINVLHVVINLNMIHKIKEDKKH
jgi:hypothetical protein